MKNLFKNSFFSFFKNKLAMSLLIIIVFLTTACFTVFNSATQAFKRSYNQVMTQGNRHEYTIKELYNIDGDVTFTDPQIVPNGQVTQDEYKVNNPKSTTAIKTIGGNEYFLIEVAADNKIFAGSGVGSDKQIVLVSANESSVMRSQSR